MKSDFIAACFFHGCRTGNQLFQIAAAYGHALRHGLECRVPWRFNSDTLALRRWLGEEAACVTDGGYGAPWVYEEPCFSYRNIPKTVRGGALSGYFQSERYFTGFDEEARFLFRRLTAPVRPGRAGIHVRMGDYLHAITLNVDHNLFRWHFQTLCYSSDYTLVGLMRNHPVNIFLRQIISCNKGLACIRHIGYSILKYSTAFLINILHMIIQSIIRMRTYRPSGFYMQER